jgi:hypothetical protein
VIPQGVEISGSRHLVSLCGPHEIKIGCHIHTIKSWIAHYKSIGNANGYSDAEIIEYKRYIDILSSSDAHTYPLQDRDDLEGAEKPK